MFEILYRLQSVTKNIFDLFWRHLEGIYVVDAAAAAAAAAAVVVVVVVVVVVDDDERY